MLTNYLDCSRWSADISLLTKIPLESTYLTCVWHTKICHPAIKCCDCHCTAPILSVSVFIDPCISNDFRRAKALRVHSTWVRIFQCWCKYVNTSAITLCKNVTYRSYPVNPSNLYSSMMIFSHHLACNLLEELREFVIYSPVNIICIHHEYMIMICPLMWCFIDWKYWTHQMICFIFSLTLQTKSN